MTSKHQWEWDSMCPPRVMRSLMVGAAAGGFSMSLCYLASAALRLGMHDALVGTVSAAASLFVVGFLVWAFGLIAIGLTPWWIFHRMGFRNLFSALVLGFSLAFLADIASATHLGGFLAPSLSASAHEIVRDAKGQLEIDYTLTARGWQVVLEGAAEIGAIGALVAAVAWRTAYSDASRARRDLGTKPLPAHTT